MWTTARPSGTAWRMTSASIGFVALVAAACAGPIGSDQATSSPSTPANSNAPAGASPAAASATNDPTSAAATFTPSPTPTSTPTPPPSYAPPGKFVRTGSMTVGRSDHSATLLLDGRVLIAGGEGSGALASAEVFDPRTGKFTRTGSLHQEREGQTATLLKDGRVLLAGGMGWLSKGNWGDLPSAELYDPASGTFSVTGSMSVARAFHTATLLEDGRVLVAGGRGDPSGDVHGLASAELYDPATGRFSAVGSMPRGHMFHTATLLNDGRVLIAGGNGDGSAELYDPGAMTFSSTGSMTGIDRWHVAALLPDGRVLVAGQGSTNIYYPEAGTFRPAAPMLNDCNCSGSLGSPSAAILLKDGRVLVPDIGPGPDSGTEFVTSVELFDPVGETFTRAGSMAVYRQGMSMTLLADGRVLFAGDQGESRAGNAPTLPPKAAAAEAAQRASAELYVP